MNQIIFLTFPGLLFLICGCVSKIEASCPLANETAVVVPSCPQTAEEREKAAARKNCENITYPCNNYTYHCVINAWMNETVEVCAPSRQIVGKACAEFSFGGNRIQRNQKATCHQCPQTYKSSDAFKYPECYEYVKRSKEINKTQNSTEAPNITSTLHSSPSSSTSNSTNGPQQEEGSSHLESELSIGIGVPVVVIGLIVFLGFRCIGRGRTTGGPTTQDACSPLKSVLLSYCTSANEYRMTREADSNADNSERKSLTGEATLQP